MDRASQSLRGLSIPNRPAMRVPEPEMTERFAKSLDWGMAAFGGRIELSDCASSDPREWEAIRIKVWG